MGKHAQYGKRSSSIQTGTLPPPLATDWALGVAGVLDYSFTRVGTIPSPATQWGIMAYRPTVAVPSTIQGAATPLTLGGLAAGTLYNGYAAWFSSTTGQRLSEWSPPKAFTTLP